MAKRKKAKAKSKAKKSAKRAPAKRKAAKKSAARPKARKAARKPARKPAPKKAAKKAKTAAKKSAPAQKASGRHPAGTFCWAELRTTTLEAGESFYGKLLGWKVEKMPMPGDQPGSYGIATLGGKSVAGMSEMGGKNGIPPHWGLFVAVDDVDASFAKAISLGAKEMMAPFDIPEVGRMAIFTDPTGAALAIWDTDAENPGFELVGNKLGGGTYGATGTFCWAELLTNDTKTAESFYTQLFGWKTKSGDFEGSTYTEWRVGSGTSIGGMMQISPDMGPMPPNWGLYFAVADCDASVETAKGLGANLLMGPMEVEGTGRFAVMMDPQGAAFNVIKLNPNLG